MDEIENNILEDEEKKEEDVKDMKINEALFKDEGNLDDLDNIIDDEEDVKVSDWAQHYSLCDDYGNEEKEVQKDNEY